MTLGRVSLGEDINSNVENCRVKLLRDLFSRLQENLESMCLPHSQWSTWLVRSGRMYTVVHGAGQNNCQGGYQLLLNLHNFV